MRDRFRVGQLVIAKLDCYSASSGEFWALRGQIGVIHKQRRFRRCSDGEWGYYYLVLFEHVLPRDPMFLCRQGELEPIADGEQKSSWALSAWKPRDLRVPQVTDARSMTLLDVEAK